MQPQLQEENPYDGYNEKIFHGRAEPPLCAGLNAVDLMMREGPVFICFQSRHFTPNRKAGCILSPEGTNAYQRLGFVKQSLQTPYAVAQTTCTIRFKKKQKEESACKTIFPFYNVIMAHKVLDHSLSGSAYVWGNTLCPEFLGGILASPINIWLPEDLGTPSAQGCKSGPGVVWDV